MKRLHTYSQNFLRSPRLARELIGYTTITAADTVYDIGAGSGILSSVLADHCQKVISVEIEPGTVALLRSNLAKYSNVEIIEADFLGLTLPVSPYKIFANIPFHLSSAIVQKITQAKRTPEVSYLIVQKQFANKLLPNHPGFSSQLGMLIGPEFSVSVRKHLKRTDFLPKPNVDTVLLEIVRRKESLVPSGQLDAYAEFVTKNFTTPAAFSALPLHLISVTPHIKPSSLTLSQWLILFGAVRQSRS